MGEIVCEYGGMTVTFATCWQPVSLDTWDDWGGCAAKPLPAFYEDARRHLAERHQVAVKRSALGFHAVHCGTCEQTIWQEPELSDAPVTAR